MSSSDGEQTSALLERLPGLLALDLEVRSTAMLTPSLRRLCLAGAHLESMEAFAGQDLMLEVPAPGHANFRRRYTIRHLRHAAREVEVDVVLHGDGPGARFAKGATAGDRVAAIGPRGKIGLAEGCDWHLFCGDESAVPAIFAMIESLAPDAHAVAVLEVGGADDQLEPEDARCAPEVHWRHRTGEPGTGHALTDAVTEIALPAGRGHAYVFGELRQVAAARAVLLERAVDAADIDHKAYWRRGTSNAAHGEPARPERD
ncbi:MAG: siderophore-interacting protein [Acidimicrobiales bacterium]